MAKIENVALASMKMYHNSESWQLGINNGISNGINTA